MNYEIAYDEAIDALNKACDKIAKLEAENERLRNFAQEVLNWSNGYPKKVFSEPTPEQVDEICKGLGCPIGWTDLRPLAMDRFHLWQRLHGKSYQKELVEEIK